MRVRRRWAAFPAARRPRQPMLAAQCSRIARPIEPSVAAAEASERARIIYSAYLGAMLLQQSEPDGANLGPALLRLLG